MSLVIGPTQRVDILIPPGTAFMAQAKIPNLWGCKKCNLLLDNHLVFKVYYREKVYVACPVCFRRETGRIQYTVKPVTWSACVVPDCKAQVRFTCTVCDKKACLVHVAVDNGNLRCQLCATAKKTVEPPPACTADCEYSAKYLCNTCGLWYCNIHFGEVNCSYCERTA